jgi:signal peptidase I
MSKKRKSDKKWREGATAAGGGAQVKTAAPGPSAPAPAASPPGSAADGGAAPRPRRTGFDWVRENLEALIVAVILALIIRHFSVEAFEIPTGSMAPTLYGIHAWLKCPNCDTEFNVALKTDSSTSVVEVPYSTMHVSDERCANPECPLELHRVLDGARCVCGACGTPFPAKAIRATKAVRLPARCPICHYRHEAIVEETNRSGGHKILVTKFAYTVSEPKRWDVIVFGFDQWKNYIKRLVGLPGERIDIWDGDIYVNGAIERKFAHPYIQEVHWTKIADSDVPERNLPHRYGDHPPAWGERSAEGSGRELRAEKLVAFNAAKKSWSLNAKGDLAVIEYQRPFDSFYNYNQLTEALWIERQGGSFVDHARKAPLVGDKKVAFTLTPLPAGGSAGGSEKGGGSRIGVEVRDRDFTFRLEIPVGGSAEAEAVLERMTQDDALPSPRREPHGDALRAERPLRAATALALVPGEPARIELENVDDRVAARLDGEEILAIEYTSLPEGYAAASPPVVSDRPEDHYLRIFALNLLAEIEDVQVYRDMYYEDEVQSIPWSGIDLAEGQYLALGDNSPASSDGRAWNHVPEANLMGKAFVVIWPAWAGSWWPSNFQWQRIR